MHSRALHPLTAAKPIILQSHWVGDLAGTQRIVICTITVPTTEDIVCPRSTHSSYQKLVIVTSPHSRAMTQICSSSSSSKCLPNAWCWCCSLRQGRMQLHVMLLCVHACSLFASRHCSVQTQLDWRRLRRLCFDPHGKSMKFGNYRRALKSAGEHGAETS